MNDSSEKESPRQKEVAEVEKAFCAIQDEIRQRYYETGKSLLEAVQSEQETINALVEESIQLRKQLAILKKEKCCPDCLALNDNDSTYCKRCGKKL